MAGASNYTSVHPPVARSLSSRIGESSSFSGSVIAEKPKSKLADPVAILWDIENCPVPGEVNAEDVAGNIRIALRLHPAVNGAVTLFSAYGDFNHFPRRLREGCQRTGVNLIDVPNGKKDASDKAILVDMFLFALDNPPPCTILLISGDVDFAPALHKLGQRGYTVVLAIPAGVGVASALCSAGRFVWDWPSVARGEGLVPAKGFSVCAGEDRMVGFMSCGAGTLLQSSDESDLPTDDEHAYGTLVGGAVPNQITSVLGESMQMSFSSEVGQCAALPVDFNRLTVTQSQNQGFAQSSMFTSQSFSSGQSFCQQMNQSPARVIASNTSNKALTNSVSTHSHLVQRQSMVGDPWVHPGDFHGLKGQLIKLLSQNGGKLPLLRVPSEYRKAFGRPLYLVEYGSPKLAHLIERMPDAFEIIVEGSQRMIQLKENVHGHRRAKAALKGKSDNLCFGNLACSENSQISGRLPRGRNNGEYEEETALMGYAEPFIDDEKGSDQQDLEYEVCPEIVEDRGAQQFMEKVGLEAFKQEMQELLVSHACRIPLSSLLILYQRRYSRDLDVTALGVEDLGTLLDKVKDVTVVKEDEVTKRKFLVAVD